MPTPFGSFPFDADGIDNFSHPLFISDWKRAPTTNDIYPAGTEIQDNSVNPPVIYQTSGAGVWVSGGNAYATTTTPGIVQLSTSIAGDASSTTLVPTVKEIKDYVDAVAIAGAPVATTTVQGIVTLATDAKAVAGTASTGLVALAVQPSNLAAVFAAPPATGGTTPAAAVFTTLGATTVTFTAGGSWASGGTAITIGTDVSTDNVSLGTAGARTVAVGSSTTTSTTTIAAGSGGLNLGTVGAKTITIGNITTTTAVNVNTGTGGMLVTTTSTGNFGVASANNAVIDAAGIVELNSSGGVINIGDDAVSQNINLGTAGARLITIGNTTTSTEVNIEVGTNGFVLDGVATSPYAISASTTSGTITIGGIAQTGNMTFGSSSANYTTLIAASTGTGVATLSLADGVNGNIITLGNGINTAAQTISIANGASAANTTLNIMSGIGTAGAGVIAFGSNTRVTTIGIANIAPAAARTITIAGGNSAQNDTVNILNGAPSANTQTVSILSGTATGGTQVLNLGNTIAGSLTVNMGNGINSTAQTVNIANGASAGDSTVNILSGIGTSGAGVLALGNNTRVTTIGLGNIAPAAARVITVAGGNQAQNDTVTILGGAASAGTQTFNLFSGNSAGATQNVNICTGTGAFGINIGTGATGVKTIAIGGTAANVITIADTQTAGSLSIGSAMTSGTIVLGSTGAGVGLATLFGGTGAQTINLANNTGVKTINIAGDSATSANVIKIGTGGSTTSALTIGSTTGGSTTTINGGTGKINLTGTNINIATSGKGLQIKSGAATDMAGTAVLVLGTVTVNNTNILTGDLIFLSRVAANGAVTLGELSYTISNGASFTINSLILGTPASIQTADVSSVAYFIIRPT